jgi:hypothetical protein
MSFIQKLKEAAKADLEQKLDNLTRPLRFDISDPHEDPESEDARVLRTKKKKLDQLYDRAPVYMATTLKDSYCKSLLESTPNDFEDIVILPHDSDNVEFMKDYKGLYSDQKDSFVIRGKKQCLYFRLKDDTKRRLIKRYVTENLNDVAQMVQEENQKIFQEGKDSFEASLSNKS